MVLHKKIAALAFILLVILSCRKDEIAPGYVDKLLGYYSGKVDRLDSVTINGNLIPIRYDSWLRFFIQKSDNAPFAIKYYTNTNYILNGYIYSGSTESEGLIEHISMTEENRFFINETTIQLWGKTVLLDGNGTYDETSNTLILNLSINDNGITKQFMLNLPKQKRLD